MGNYNDMLKDFVNKDYDELLNLAKRATADVIPACKAVDTKADGFIMMTSIILSAIGADGTLTALERQFLRDLTGFDDATISSWIDTYNADMVDLTDHFVDNMGDDTKAATLILCMAICSVDETISREETAFLTKLLA